MHLLRDRKTTILNPSPLSSDQQVDQKNSQTPLKFKQVSDFGMTNHSPGSWMKKAASDLRIFAVACLDLLDLLRLASSLANIL